VAVFDLVTDDDGQWLVMEYVEGTTLAGLVKEEGALPPERATRLLQQAADALAAAHSAGIVHRDVKPSNMLVDRDDRVKLSDFGIAKAEADATLTQTGLVTGSPAYLAPEVASGRPATDASDVWSLGASLFHALAGRPPYEVGDNLMGTLYQIVHEDPPRLEDAGWLAPLLEATMTQDPADRWSMAQVRDYLAAGPSATRPTPVPAAAPVPVPEPAPAPPVEHTQAMRPVAPPRRSRTPLLVAAGVVLLVALVGVAWTMVTGGDSPSATPTGGGGSSSAGGGPTSDDSPPEQPTAAGMETFISDYLTTAAADPSQSFPMLTKSFQAARFRNGQYLINEEA
jgi:serine/threonine protein kinase